MIVVDTNVIAYLLLPGKHTEFARAAYNHDSDWVAPILWRSEFRNVLATALQQGQLQLHDALDVMRLATELMDGGEFEVDSSEVLSLAADSSCSAYDCEFVVLARELGVHLVTADRKTSSSFPSSTVELVEFGSGPD